MRDRNLLSYQQFNIQLEKTISSGFKKFGNRRNYFSHELSLEFRPFELHREPVISYRKDFRTLRSLIIIHWYLPENLHFLVNLLLSEESLNWLNLKQKLELKVLLNSKESMSEYLFLTERYTGNEIFGNILGNDLKDLSRNFKISFRFYPIPRRKIRRRGPKDKGSRRFISQGPFFEKDVMSDVFLQLENEKFNRKEILFTKLVNKLLISLRVQFEKIESDPLL